jgi:hypothetical protein
MKRKILNLLGVTFMLTCAVPANGQNQDGMRNRDEAKNKQTENELDPIPTPPQITPNENAGLQQQAGVGSDIAYSSAGVLELGGFMSMTQARDYSEIGIAPFIGYFFADNLQISALASWNYVETKDESASITSLLLEPSIHMPVSNSNFLFAGLGAGIIIPSGRTHSLAFAPRVGYKRLVGRSGILTLALQAMYGLSSESELQSARGTVLSVESVSQLTAGYTVIL